MCGKAKKIDFDQGEKERRIPITVPGRRHWDEESLPENMN